MAFETKFAFNNAFNKGAMNVKDFSARAEEQRFVKKALPLSVLNALAEIAAQPVFNNSESTVLAINAAQSVLSTKALVNLKKQFKRKWIPGKGLEGMAMQGIAKPKFTTSLWVEEVHHQVMEEAVVLPAWPFASSCPQQLTTLAEHGLAMDTAEAVTFVAPSASISAEPDEKRESMKAVKVEVPVDPPAKRGRKPKKLKVSWVDEVKRTTAAAFAKPMPVAAVETTSFLSADNLVDITPTPVAMTGVTSHVAMVKRDTPAYFPTASLAEIRTYEVSHEESAVMFDDEYENQAMETETEAFVSVASKNNVKYNVNAMVDEDEFGLPSLPVAEAY